jgi:hypothetical protein
MSQSMVDTQTWVRATNALPRSQDTARTGVLPPTFATQMSWSKAEMREKIFQNSLAIFS